ncbi:putative sulfotransferase domain protein [Desulfosarcina variabilis str. Montpellier]|uniref:sulfotransferase family protein n=1 Tax=Desulfosarcina variabilis TaxID=2300 RepID=UPI003AFA366C
MDKKLIYIAGSSRTGSTLLDLLLNNHKWIISIGEMDRLPWFMSQASLTCSCGNDFNHCVFWRKVQSLGCEKLGVPPYTPLLIERSPSFREVSIGTISRLLYKALMIQPSKTIYHLANLSLFRPFQKAAQNCLFWNDIIREVTDCPVVVDSSKIAFRMKALYFADPKNIRIIHMIRDGRAVAASEIRRTQRPMKIAARRWYQAQKKIIFCLKGIPNGQIFRLHYEQFCSDPNSTLQELCDFVNIPYQENMLVLNKHGIHNVGGNPMRFRRGETDIKLDERWKQELGPEDLDTFNGIAGRLNRSFRYS